MQDDSHHMSAPSDIKLSDQHKADLTDLIAWLRRCPSRHRHLLFLLQSELYSDLVHVESSARTLAEKVEALLAKYT